MNCKNLTANLLRLASPFYYWQSHLPYVSADGLLSIQFACLVFHGWNSSRQISGLHFSNTNDKNFLSAAKILCIHDKLTKSQSPHKATHFRGQLFQLPDVFRFFDFFFGGLISLTALVLFSYNQNAAFFTNVALTKSAFAMWLKDRPCFLYILTLHLSEIANYFVIITERLYLIQRRLNMAVKLTLNEHDYCHGNIWLTSTKTLFLKWENIIDWCVCDWSPL